MIEFCREIYVEYFNNSLTAIVFFVIMVATLMTIAVKFFIYMICLVLEDVFG